MQVTKEMIEAGARAIHDYRSSALWQEITGQWQEHCRGEAKAALEAALSAMWQAIESAPRDGTYIDIWDSYGGRITDVKFSEDGWIKWSRDSDGLWDLSELSHEPTHWMPLPPAPETT